MENGERVYWKRSEVHKDKQSIHTCRPQLLKDLNKHNTLADYMKNHLGLQYTTYLINCHLKTQGFDTVCKSTVNPTLKRQKIQKFTKNEGKWK